MAGSLLFNIAFTWYYCQTGWWIATEGRHTPSPREAVEHVEPWAEGIRTATRRQCKTALARASVSAADSPPSPLRGSCWLGGHDARHVAASGWGRPLLTVPGSG